MYVIVTASGEMFGPIAAWERERFVGRLGEGVQVVPVRPVRDLFPERVDEARLRVGRRARR